jgi:hypothetical protein
VNCNLYGLSQHVIDFSTATKSKMKFVASSNLITDLNFKKSVGVKADASEEVLAIINQNLAKDNEDLNIDQGVRDTLQVFSLLLRHDNAL